MGIRETMDKVARSCGVEKSVIIKMIDETIQELRAKDPTNENYIDLECEWDGMREEAMR